MSVYKTHEKRTMIRNCFQTVGALGTHLSSSRALSLSDLVDWVPLVSSMPGNIASLPDRWTTIESLVLLRWYRSWNFVHSGEICYPPPHMIRGILAFFSFLTQKSQLSLYVFLYNHCSWSRFCLWNRTAKSKGLSNFITKSKKLVKGAEFGYFILDVHHWHEVQQDLLICTLYQEKAVLVIHKESMCPILQYSFNILCLFVFKTSLPDKSSYFLSSQWFTRCQPPDVKWASLGFFFLAFFSSFINYLLVLSLLIHYS